MNAWRGQWRKWVKPTLVQNAEVTLTLQPQQDEKKQPRKDSKKRTDPNGMPKEMEVQTPANAYGRGA